MSGKNYFSLKSSPFWSLLQLSFLLLYFWHSDVAWRHLGDTMTPQTEEDRGRQRNIELLDWNWLSAHLSSSCTFRKTVPPEMSVNHPRRRSVSFGTFRNELVCLQRPVMVVALGAASMFRPEITGGHSNSSYEMFVWRRILKSCKLKSTIRSPAVIFEMCCCRCPLIRSL